jgi:hypothetical protein
MVLFHKTLNDAMAALKKGRAKDALEILQEHKQAELTEENFINSSLYAIRMYLQNYINRLDGAMNLLNKAQVSETEIEQAKAAIERCESNIKAFEEGTKELLTREHALLE